MSDTSAGSNGNARWIRLIPTVFAMYTIAFFDRINFGLAIPSLIRDLHISPTQAGFASGIFFWGYLVTFLASGWLAPRFGAKWTIFGSLIVWGVFAIGTGLARNFTELLVMRFLLGAAEGPVWTSTSMLLSQWFVTKERARAFGLWNLCIPIGALLAGPISGLILTYSNWHMMFILEGLPAWVWAAVWWRNIPGRLEDAAWMRPEERRELSAALAAEQVELGGRHESGWRTMLLDRNVWLLLGSFSLINMLGYGFNIWLPSAIKAAGSLHIGSVGLLSALPYLTSIFGLILITQSSDRFQERRRHAGFPMMIVGVLLGLGAYFGNHSVTIQMIAFISMGFFLYMFLPIIFSLVTEILPREMAIPAIAFIGGVGNLFGGFVGPTLVGWIKQMTGSFMLAFIVLSIFGILGGLLALLVRVPSQAKLPTGLPGRQSTSAI